MWLGLNDVEPLQSIQQFEEYQENPDLFQQKMADRKERDEVRKALNLKKSVEKADIKSGETKLKKNVLTRMQRKMDTSAMEMKLNSFLCASSYCLSCKSSVF